MPFLVSEKALSKYSDWPLGNKRPNLKSVGCLLAALALGSEPLRLKFLGPESAAWGNWLYLP